MPMTAEDGLKLSIGITQERDMMDFDMDDPELVDLPFAVARLPLKFPPLSQLVMQVEREN